MADKYAHSPGYLSAVAMSATITGEWIDIRDKDNISFQVITTTGSTPVGTISFEVTNAAVTLPATLGAKNQPKTTPAGIALTLTSAQAAAAIINNNALAFVFEFNQMSEAWIRMIYTRSSGGDANSVLTAAVCSKGI